MFETGEFERPKFDCISEKIVYDLNYHMEYLNETSQLHLTSNVSFSYPPQTLLWCLHGPNFVCGGYTVFTLSVCVCASVCASIRP